VRKSPAVRQVKMSPITWSRCSGRDNINGVVTGSDGKGDMGKGSEIKVNKGNDVGCGCESA
jgi:hypothetical protein